METVLTDTNITLEELIRQVRQSARPIYVGTDGEIDIVVRSVKKDIEPEQASAVGALSDLFHKLQLYEARYRMDSEAFFYKYENALLDESPDFISWWISYSAFAETLMRYNLTRSDVECRLMAGSERTTGAFAPS
ncbi:MAG: hypothetical protein H8E90_00645 [Anaerolineales bacterium]|nr:hypothetical protein [Anaerolineales bacterium]